MRRMTVLVTLFPLPVYVESVCSRARLPLWLCSRHVSTVSIGNYRRFEATFRHLVTEDEDTAFLRNAGIFTSLYGVTSQKIVHTQVTCPFVKYKRIVGTQVGWKRTVVSSGGTVKCGLCWTT